MKQQTIKEDELGIPSLEFMKQDDLINICKNQAGFIGFICEPLWKCVTSAFPEIIHLYKNALMNKDCWNKKKEILEREQINNETKAFTTTPNTNEKNQDNKL